MIGFHQNISEINAEQWQLLIEAAPTASFFQTKECYDFYASTSFMEPFVYGVSEAEHLVGVICGYIIAEGGELKQFFSRRAIVPGGALLSGNIKKETLERFLSFVGKQLKHRVIYLEMRNYNDFSLYKTAFAAARFRYQSHLNIHVDTSNRTKTTNKISESKKRQFKLSMNRGVSFEQTDCEYEIVALYDCLRKTYEQKIKKPLFPVEFFLKLNKLSSSAFFVVKNENRVVGGLVTVFLKNKCLYEWFVCGEESAELKIYPSVVATMGGINYALENNIKRFDFMGAGRPDKSYGVREFKSKFGGDLVEHGRFLYICKPFLYNIGKFIIFIKSKI